MNRTRLDPANLPVPGHLGPALAQAVAAALDWWREAGVDGDWTDAPQDWLATARTPRAPPRDTAPALLAQPAPLFAGGPANWPTDLSAFANWWLTEPDLAPAGARRIAPAGPAAPPLMVVVPMPEADDGETLLSGPAGRVLDGFLAAAGLSRGRIYCAAALPSRITAPDWAALAQSGLGEVLTRHIALVAPKRLILFGQNSISALISNGSAKNPTSLPAINHDGPSVPMLGAYDLESIVARPALKQRLWSRWLDWTPA